MRRTVLSGGRAGPLVLALASWRRVASPQERHPAPRGPTPLTREDAAPPPMQRQVNDDVRRPQLPRPAPGDPAHDRGLPIDLNANKCLTCHAAQFTAKPGPDDQRHPLHGPRRPIRSAAVSPRRYFCTFMPRLADDVAPLVENRFTDIDTMRRAVARRAAEYDGGDASGPGASAPGASWIGIAARRPPPLFSLAFLTLGGFVAGVIFWGGFNTALEATNTENFCTSLPRDAATTCSRS